METAPKEPACPNCGSTAIGKYCAACGQPTAPVQLSVGRLLKDVLEDQFSLNSAFPRTMRALFLKPGFLTTEYLSLRIARYIAPFRLYLIASVLFFVLASFLSSRAQFRVTDEDRAELQESRAEYDSIVAERARRGLPAPQARRGVQFSVGADTSAGNWLDSARVNLGNEWLNRAVKARLHNLGELPPTEAARRMFRTTIEQTPKVLFVLLPVYAFMLKLLYVRKKRFYVEHFIFALHLHAFVFLVFFAMLALQDVPFVSLLLGFWIPIYSLIAMKRVYQQGWPLTILKGVTLGFAYFVLLCFGLVAAFLGALFVV